MLEFVPNAVCGKPLSDGTAGTGLGTSVAVHASGFDLQFAAEFERLQLVRAARNSGISRTCSSCSRTAPPRFRDSRQEERRVGKALASTCIPRRSPDH